MRMSSHELFIRFKDIPPDELSAVHDGDAGIVRYETGTSCYDFTYMEDGTFRITMSSVSTGFLYDLIHMISETESGHMPCYLIRARRVGTGTYNEPVVRDIKIIGELCIRQFAEPKPQFKLDRTNPQIVLKESYDDVIYPPGKDIT